MTEKPPLTEIEWLKINYYKDRSNDDKMLWEGEEFLRSLTKKYKLKDPIKAFMTWVERKYGKDFDPETMCCYTELALFKQPIWSPAFEHRPAVLSMGYFREDGELMRVRDLTPAEADWVRDEPEQFAADCKGFMKWLKKVRNK